MTENKNLNGFVGNTDEMNENPSQPNTVENNVAVENSAAVDNQEVPVTEVPVKQAEELDPNEEMELKALLLMLRDMIMALYNALLQANGKLVDFSDKEGRKCLLELLLLLPKKLESILSKNKIDNNEFISSLEKVIPKEVKAQFDEVDRNRIDFLRRYVKWITVGLFAAIIIIPCTSFFICGKIVGKVNARSAALEQWYVNNQNAVNFGNYMREYNPKTYAYWHSGRWQKNKALRDSMAEANKMADWK